MIPDCYGLYGILMRPICIVVEEPRQAQYFDMKWEHRDLSDEGLANSSPCRMVQGSERPDFPECWPASGTLFYLARAFGPSLSSSCSTFGLPVTPSDFTRGQFSLYRVGVPSHFPDRVFPTVSKRDDNRLFSVHPGNLRIFARTEITQDKFFVRISC